MQRTAEAQIPIKAVESTATIRPRMTHDSENGQLEEPWCGQQVQPKFAFFMKVPVEIRIMIYDLVLLDRREFLLDWSPK